MPTAQPTETAPVKIWDPLVRLFHWSLAIGFAVAYLTEDELQNIHTLAGYTVLGLVLFRILWGIVGSRHARFSDFVYSPGQVLTYLKQIVSRSGPRYLGHNPAGGVMVLLLLASLLATTLTGLAAYGMEGHGPLAGMLTAANEELFEQMHELLANFTLLLVVLHLAGVAYSSWEHRENLPRAMVTGLKRANADGAAAEERPSAAGVATLLGVLLLVGGLVGIGWALPSEEGEHGERHGMSGEHGQTASQAKDDDDDEEHERRPGR